MQVQLLPRGTSTIHVTVNKRVRAREELRYAYEQHQHDDDIKVPDSVSVLWNWCQPASP